MRRLVLCTTAVASVVVAAAPARAADHDEQVWASITATKALSGKVDATMEAHSRYTDGVSRMGQLLLRPSVTLKLARGWSLTAGYVYVRTRFRGELPNTEHRSWEQVAYTFAENRETGLLINGRTRIEQRFREGADGVGWRLRQQVRARLPLPGGGPVRAIVWNETFVGLNTTEWDRHKGVDQVRTFIGLGLPVADGITVEPGYMNQTIFRIGPDRVNHVLAANIFATF